MSKYGGLWYGGSNYANPDPDRDLEPFDSIKAAGRTLQARADGDPYYPCVSDEQSEIHLYAGGEYHENGPDYVLTLGKRGGVRVSK